MSLQFYDRRVSVVVSNLDGSGAREFSSRDDSEGFSFGGAGFRIGFSIEKTKKKFPNKATVDIYNLSRDSAAAIDDQRKLIQIFGGYGDVAQLMFQGEIRAGKAKTVQQGSDRITQIEAGDGANLFRSARLNKTFRGQVTMKRIINEVATAFGVNAVVPSTVADEAITFGITASGPARDVMDHIADSLGLDWFFDDGQLVVDRKDGDRGRKAVLLTGQTGLIGSPEKTSKGVSGVSLLNPRIRPKTVVELRLPRVKGFYVVTSVEHRGDSGYAQDFYTAFEARAIA